MRVPAKIFTAVFFLAGALCACASRPAPHGTEPTSGFWHDCQETIPANKDGFQHFTCTDVKNRRWEILVRREGK
jgi:hypothetical protein